MFGIFRAAKARGAVVEVLRSFVVRPELFGPWPPEFWSDPFVLGFVVAAIALVGREAAGAPLTTKQSGQVMIGAVKELGGYSPDFTNRIEHFMKARDPDYLLGIRNAGTVVNFVMDLCPMHDDPEVIAAAGLAKGLTLSGSVDRDDIGGALIHTLFHEVVNQRLGLR